MLQAGLDDPNVDRSLLAYALSLPEELTLLGEMEVGFGFWVCLYACLYIYEYNSTVCYT